MKALVFHKPGDVRVEKIDDPKIEAPRDAIIRVTATAICGSDLHIYNGFLPQPRPMALGHEFMGIVEETGSGVGNLKKGDRVVVPFPIACGCCFFCGHDLPGHCTNSNPKHYGPEGGMTSGKGGALFGYTDVYGGYNGGQAEFVRVPYADYGPRKVPDTLSDEQVLFLTDIFPTGYCGVDWANVKGGETIAVFGCGPVGLMAMKSAWLRGAARVIGVDIEPYRLAMARKASGAEIVNAKETDPIEYIRGITENRGADVCIDAVGMEAHRTLLDKAKNLVTANVGSIDALQSCIDAVRRGGTVSVLGVYGTSVTFPLGQVFDKGINMQFGQAQAQKLVDRLLEHIEKGEFQADDIITHRLTLDDAPHGYEIFSKKQDNCVKVVMTP
jgi:S-(hydroxymethyl)glutathione dehydrogenase/alcohol dehydrogenase